MKIGLQLPNFTWPEGPARIAPRLADIARAAEEAGFYSLWVMDHFFQISMIGPPENDMLEGYTTLGYLAGLTRRVKLGTMVTGVIYRHPGILVKTATTLDVLSGGRAYFGIGAAWNEQESRGLGVPFPPLGPPTTGRIAASIISSSKPCAFRSRCRVPTRRFWSRAAVRKRPCAWSLNMRMPATCSAAPRPCAPSSTF
jgi:hypothetical protein